MIPSPHSLDDVTSTEDEPLHCPTHIRQVWVRGGSALLLTGPSFFDYAHGISPADSDIWLSENFVNATSLCGAYQEGEEVRRGRRISLVLWSN
jgi:hypothetical protein